MSEVREHGRVRGVLPWRRPSDADLAELAPILRALRQHHGKADAKLVQRAYEVARACHADQFRESGEAYISHPMGVARLLAERGFDSKTVTAALLHDVVEDSEIELDELRDRFGDEVADLVDGVTKLDRLAFHTREAAQAATLRKMLVAMASDIHVLVIKIADRLHNMTTIEALEEPRRRRIAQETLDIYAPLAHRLGMQEFKAQLEEISFKVLHPKAYAEINQLVKERAPEIEKFTSGVVAEVRDHLANAKIAAEVTGRTKHYYSIYEKMVIDRREFNDIYDLVGIRIIVKSIKDCYGALGAIHAIWPPITGRFKDFIAMPKFNLYQSLHTTVMGPEGKSIEIQIRTEEMHRTAEYGIAAHWQYKDERRGGGATADKAWLNAMLEWQPDAQSPQDFLESLKVDLYQDSVFVFTPKGDVVELPRGATPIDFAYQIHTEVGHRCTGARVDGRLVQLSTPLESGNTVEVFTSKAPEAGPSRDWIRIARTTKARSKIRQYFIKERREDAIEEGRRRLDDELRRSGIKEGWHGIAELVTELLSSFNYTSEQAFLAAVGEGHLSPRSIAQKVSSIRTPAVEADELIEGELPVKRRASGATDSPNVIVEGLDDVWVRLARDCNPIPGDAIIGFVTRGRGVSVHRSDCPNLEVLTSGAAAGRVVEVEWDPARESPVVVAIQVEALDRHGLLRDLTSVLASTKVNIVSANTHTGRDRIALMRFEFELGDATHLASILDELRRVDGVFDSYRVVPGNKGT